MLNSEVIVDILYVQGKSLLHVVNQSTHLQVDRLLRRRCVSYRTHYLLLI